MLTVIIADDEPVIVKGLRSLIAWADCGLSIVDAAGDGRELWDKVKEQKPDIVISDISMPQMTGLEFLRRLKQENMDTQVIFISGYQKFEYAQEAIRLGAVDYLLKPVLREAMEEAVKKARLRFQNQEQLELFREDENAFSEYESFERMGMDCKGKLFAAVCFYIDEKKKRKWEAENYKKVELLKFSAFNRIRKFFKDRKRGVPMKREDDCLYMLCLAEPGEKENFLTDYVSGAMAYAEGDKEPLLHAGVGSFSENIKDWDFLYDSGKFAYEMRYFMDKRIICTDRIHRKFSYSFEDYERQQKKILDALVQRNPEVMEEFEACIELIKNLHYGNRYAVLNRCILFAGKLYEDLESYGAVTQEERQKQLEFMEKLRTSMDFNELKAEFLAYYMELAKRISENAVRWDNSSIAEVVDYMKAHFETDINMRKMAEMACVNPVYFGALFKKTTGWNFKSFLTDLRMEEAKRLVITTDLKTYAIAEKVGYANTRQFTEKFKEYYGSTPAEYKKKLADQ